ncbi:MAG: Gfo/Idh/MocA family oxidoreductase [Verrucomicrobia bacterium]|nr:Gfo/Idh/MocA family oxidoreductase [Verrucomicrobiota bacterium]
MKLTRRNFLKASAFTAAAFSLPARSWANVVGSNEAIRVAVVGFNSRGMDALGNFTKKEIGTRVVAICDVDSNVLNREVDKFKKRGETVAPYVDFRKLLESKEIDAVAIATPNHWHALGAIWGVQAGKDVYVEKPVSHNVWEGRKIVEAARKYNRIVQTGTQARSSFAIREAVEWVRQGNLGKLLVARGTCYKRRESIGKVTSPQPIPDNIDYNLWCGPAQMKPLMRSKLHYDWHWDFETGNGDLGNQGIHQMDIARWFLGENALSPRVFSIGGRLSYDDDGNTPNTQIVFHDYKAAPLIFEVRGLPEKSGAKDMDKFMESRVGVLIHCEGGHVLVPNYSSAIVYDKEGKEIKRFQGAENHYANFVKAVLSRKSSDLNADILEGHLSSALCHTANISYRLGKEAPVGKIKEKIKGNKEASETLGRMLEHLQLNDVDVNKTPLTMGEFLKMDPRAEKFIGNRKANQLLTRKYRAPFVVPDRV